MSSASPKPGSAPADAPPSHDAAAAGVRPEPTAAEAGAHADQPAVDADAAAHATQSTTQEPGPARTVDAGPAQGFEPAHSPTDSKAPFPGEPAVPDDVHMSAMDYEEHERTFSGFMAITKWGTGVVVVVLILMAWFLL